MTTTTPTTTDLTRAELEANMNRAYGDLVRAKRLAKAARKPITRQDHEQMIKNIQVFIAEQKALLPLADAAAAAAIASVAEVQQSPVTIEDVEAAWQAWHDTKAAFKAADSTGLEAAHAAVKAAFKVAIDTQADFNTTPGIIARYDDEYTWPTRYRFGIEAWIENRPSGKKAQFWAVVQCGDERSGYGPIDNLDQQSRLQGWINERCHELVLWCAALGESFEIVPDGTPADVEAEALASDPDDDEIDSDTVIIDYGTRLPFEPATVDKQAACSACGDPAIMQSADGFWWCRSCAYCGACGATEDCPDCAALGYGITEKEYQVALLELEAQAGAEACACGAAVAYRFDGTGEGVCRECHIATLQEWYAELYKSAVWAIEVQNQVIELAAA